MATSFKDSLAVLAKARFPILYVETFEERRALAEIQATVGPGGLLPSPRPLHTWSITAGLVDPEGKSAPGTTDPLRALDAAQHTDHAATFAFLDLHAHLGDGARPADPAIVRKLRELSMDFQNGALPRTLIVVAPTLRIPPELEKDIHILDFPLPDETALRRILDNLIDANAGNRRLHISLSETDRDRLVRASLGLTESEAEGALALAMATDGVLDASDVDTVLQEKKQAVRKSGLLEYVDTDIDLDGVGGGHVPGHDRCAHLERDLRLQQHPQTLPGLRTAGGAADHGPVVLGQSLDIEPHPGDEPGVEQVAQAPRICAGGVQSHAESRLDDLASGVGERVLAQRLATGEDDAVE